MDELGDSNKNQVLIKELVSSVNLMNKMLNKILLAMYIYFVVYFVMSLAVLVNAP